jgi:hypothetical protein
MGVILVPPAVIALIIFLARGAPVSCAARVALVIVLAMVILVAMLITMAAKQDPNLATQS